ncbi:FecR family protein [Verrucomicrobium spinosum]|uniref:FecR family protein n=1 Tax=Verrucomicrobium spinosum TaxID=2736 RepID=UPI0009462CA5|nr:FecR domain-containing protein [Verrucomicrobium spinosum]
MLTLSAAGVWILQSRNTYATGIAETRQITLPDGTRVHLDAQTSLHYEATGSGRTVHLRHGAAVFQVAPHPTPFKVAADTWSVRDIGTTFQVLLRHDAPHGTVEVGVAEGEVELTSERHPATPPVRLSAGEETTWEDGSDRPSDKTQTASPGDFATWRDGRLRYRNRPLSQVLADLQRHQKDRLVLLDPELGRLTVTGTLSTRDLKQAYTALEQILPLRFAVQGSGEVQVLRR